MSRRARRRPDRDRRLARHASWARSTVEPRSDGRDPRARGSGTRTRAPRSCRRCGSPRSERRLAAARGVRARSADALDLTPAYCQAVASFYDMFHLEPVGRHSVEVCTNLSCALVGAQQVVEAFESELGVRARRDDRGRRGHAAHGRVPRRLRLRDRRRRRPPLPPARQAGRRARDRGGAPWGLGRSLLAGADERDLTKLAEYQAIGGYKTGRRRRAKMSSDELIDELQKANLRGRGGAGFPMGRKASLVDRSSPKPQVPGRQRRRVRAGRVQGPRDHGTRAAPAARGLPDRRARDRVEGRLHLHPRRVPDRVRDPAGGRRRGSRGGPLRRRERRRPPRRRRVHLRRGDRAARVARGQARPAAATAAVPAGPGPLHVADRRSTTSRRSRPCPTILELGADEFAKIGRRDSPGTASSRSPATSRSRATTSSSSARRCAS